MGTLLEADGFSLAFVADPGVLSAAFANRRLWRRKIMPLAAVRGGLPQQLAIAPA